MKHDDEKKLSKIETKRAVKRYKEKVIVNYVSAMRGDSKQIKRIESL